MPGIYYSIKSNVDSTRNSALKILGKIVRSCKVEISL